MKIWPKIVFVGASFLFFGTMASPSSAKPAVYCLECHSQNYSQKYSQPFLLPALPGPEAFIMPNWIHARSTFVLRGSFFHRKPDPQAGSDYKQSGAGKGIL